MYEPPIEIVQHTIRDAIDKHIDDCVYKAVVRTDIHVDREELIRALQYDRDQFQKGFAAGVEWAGPKWISVEDKPEPDENGEYWCYGYWFGSGNKQCETAEYFGEWKIVNNFILTHWMPLPEPPKEE